MFSIGCNYWASHAGIYMWSDFNEDEIRKDLKALTAHGMICLRVFPLWSDFQPIEPMMSCHGELRRIAYKDDAPPANPYYLDETMMDRFARFCDLCGEYGITLIVGLLTGWMSGRLFIPTALYGKNLYTDPAALLFEQRFVMGFVSRFKDRKEIYAWDLGNECNCLGEAVSRFEADNWTAVISGAIRRCDGERPIISGMHGLDTDGTWTIQGQGEFCGVLTTHPYPYFVPHADKACVTAPRTLLHATAETKFYSDVSGKRGLVEEIGNLGPMLCSDGNAARFLRYNLFSNWANGADGLLWWCGFDLTHVDKPPYTWNMCEVELGVLRNDRSPKPIAAEMQKFSDFLQGLDFDLPPAKTDAVCLLTMDGKQWGKAYMTYAVAKQAGLNLRFAYCENELPESRIYLLPSVSTDKIMPADAYRRLFDKVADGAVLYLSNDAAILREFKKYIGMELIDAENTETAGTFSFGGNTFPYSRHRTHHLAGAGAEILAADDRGEPMLTAFSLGKGKVFYLNFPMETALLDKSDVIGDRYAEIYRQLFWPYTDKAVFTENPYLAVTEHVAPAGTYAVILNCADTRQAHELKTDRTLKKVIRGNAAYTEPFDCSILLFE